MAEEEKKEVKNFPLSKEILESYRKGQIYAIEKLASEWGFPCSYQEILLYCQNHGSQETPSGQQGLVKRKDHETGFEAE